MVIVFYHVSAHNDGMENEMESVMTPAPFDTVKAYNLTNMFNFIGVSAGGRRTAVSVPAWVVIRLANAMKSTDSVGHAVYHFNTPGDPNPCSMCGIKA